MLVCDNLLYKVVSFGHMKCQLKSISVSLTPPVVIIAITTETFIQNQVCSCVIIPHRSLRANALTAIGAIVLASALQQNKSLEELK